MTVVGKNETPMLSYPASSQRDSGLGSLPPLGEISTPRSIAAGAASAGHSRPGAAIQRGGRRGTPRVMKLSAAAAQASRMKPRTQRFAFGRMWWRIFNDQGAAQAARTDMGATALPHTHAQRQGQEQGQVQNEGQRLGQEQGQVQNEGQRLGQERRQRHGVLRRQVRGMPGALAPLGSSLQYSTGGTASGPPWAPLDLSTVFEFCWQGKEDRAGTGVPMVCASGLEEVDGVCYSPCGAGFDSVGDTCWQHCPEGWTDYGPASCIKAGGMYYGLCYFFDFFKRACTNCTACREGYHRVPARHCECWPDSFNKSSFGRGPGIAPGVCDPLSGFPELIDGLCYAPCGPGYYSNGTLCWAWCNQSHPGSVACSASFSSASCARDSATCSWLAFRRTLDPRAFLGPAFPSAQERLREAKASVQQYRSISLKLQRVGDVVPKIVRFSNDALPYVRKLLEARLMVAADISNRGRPSAEGTKFLVKAAQQKSLGTPAAALRVQGFSGAFLVGLARLGTTVAIEDFAMADPTGLAGLVHDYRSSTCRPDPCQACAVIPGVCHGPRTCSQEGACGDAPKEDDGTPCVSYDAVGNTVVGMCKGGECDATALSSLYNDKAGLATTDPSGGVTSEARLLDGVISQFVEYEQSCSFSNGGCGVLLCVVYGGKLSCVDPPPQFAPLPYGMDFSNGRVISWSLQLPLDCMAACLEAPGCTVAATSWALDCWLMAGTPEAVPAPTFQGYKRLTLPFTHPPPTHSPPNTLQSHPHPNAPPQQFPPSKHVPSQPTPKLPPTQPPPNSQPPSKAPPKRPPSQPPSKPPPSHPPRKISPSRPPPKSPPPRVPSSRPPSNGPPQRVPSQPLPNSPPSQPRPKSPPSQPPPKSPQPRAYPNGPPLKAPSKLPPLQPRPKSPPSQPPSKSPSSQPHLRYPPSQHPPQSPKSTAPTQSPPSQAPLKFNPSQPTPKSSVKQPPPRLPP